jgi:hypothetical protein
MRRLRPLGRPPNRNFISAPTPTPEPRRPTRRNLARPTLRNRRVAHEIHNLAEKISLTELNTFFESILDTSGLDHFMSNPLAGIDTMMRDLMQEETVIEKFEPISVGLQFINFKKYEKMLPSIFYALKYTKTQPPLFQNLYLEVFWTNVIMHMYRACRVVKAYLNVL